MSDPPGTLGIPDHVALGCGAGFSGDRVDAPIAVVDHLATLDVPKVLVLETLGERTLALAQKALLDDPDAGYEPLLEQLFRPVLAKCLQSGIRIVGNFGAANPWGAAKALKRIAAETGAREPKIAIVLGDDLSDRLDRLELTPWEGEPDDLVIEHDRMVAANAYLGCRGIREGLDGGADIVVTGRVADPALVLGPLLHHFRWDEDDWDLIAAGLLAGHLLECGSQVSGGYFADPGKKDVEGLDNIGYPIARIARSGEIVIGKPPGTGGLVTSRTVKEQLLYEIHDPARYITPDGIVDLTDVEVIEKGRDRVAVTGVRGKPATDTYKVTISLRGGWLGEGEISYAGPNAEARARAAGRVLEQRLERRGLDLRRRVDLIGVVSIFGDDEGRLRDQSVGDAEDVRVRLAVESDDRDAVAAATQEVLALLCSGPAGGGGARRRHVERIHTVSCLVPKSEVPEEVRFL